MKNIATLYLLDSKGRVIKQKYVEYHSTEWANAVSTGWITHRVDLLPC